MIEGDYSSFLLTAVNKNKRVGYAVLNNEGFLYVSEGFAGLLGFDREELLNKNLLDIFGNNFYSLIDELRDNGNKSVVRTGLELKTSGGSIRFSDVHLEKIDNTGNGVFLLQVVDITKEELSKTFYHLVSVVNKSIISSDNEEDLFSSVCEGLAETKYIDLVWVFGLDDSSGDMIAYSGSGKFVENSLRNIRKAIKRQKNAPIYEALREDKIIVIKDVETDSRIKPYVDVLLEYGLKSVCYVPIKKDDKCLFTLNIYSGVRGYFDDYLVPVLKEMQLDLNYFFKNYKELLFKKIFFEAMKNTGDWVLVTDSDGVIQFANDAVVWLSGYNINEIVGKKPSIFKSDKYDESFYKSLWDTILMGKVYRGVIINKNKNGDLYQLYHTITPIKTKERVTHFVDISKDISREMYLEEQIRKFRFYDQLTGLLNVDGFMNEVEKLISGLDKEKLKLGMAIFVVDIYDFNKINKVYGFNTADKVLIEAGKILSKKGKLASRLGDDEFGIFLFFEGESELERKINSIIERFKTPVVVDNQHIDLSVNVGIAIVKDEKEIRNYITNATNAVNEAKHLGPHRFKIFDDELNRKIHKDYEIKQLISESLSNGFFIFHFQPVIRVDNCEVAEFEALARIEHPERGLVYPGEFMEYLERSEYLYDFESYLVKTMPNYLNQMKEISKKVVPVSVNLSMSSLSTGKVFEVLKDIDKFLIENITLEITERIFSEDIDKAKEELEALKDMGFKIMIDDFGTGYSSLQYIHTLPVDAIKIDISFVRNMMVDEKVREVVRATTIMANALGFETVAEGVETKEQVELLKNFGVTYLQGYYFSKPLPHKDAFKLLLEGGYEKC